MPVGDLLEGARRNLIEGRLLVEAVEATLIRARCRGAHGTFTLGFCPARGWWCECAARNHCAHLLALYLVTRRPHGAHPGVADLGEGVE